MKTVRRSEGESEVSKSGKVVKLPNREEIMRRLGELDIPTALAEKFFPRIAREAEKELTAEDVVLMLSFEISDFVTSGYPAAMEDVLHLQVPKFIDALINDEEVAEEAKGFYREATDS